MFGCIPKRTVTLSLFLFLGLCKPMTVIGLISFFVTAKSNLLGHKEKKQQIGFWNKVSYVKSFGPEPSSTPQSWQHKQ